jgi:hypothetical protein
VENEAWINDQVREELTDLRRRYGFEEAEALAFWHLRKAGALMNDMRAADINQDLDRMEAQEQRSGRDGLAALVVDVARWHAVVYQHFAALNRALGQRVLRRNFPEGWGFGPAPEEEQQPE